MIESYLLENLKAVYECGTVSAAAERLNMSQPTVSRSMQKLEESLGVSLFERKKNRLVLNATGRLAAEYAIDLLNRAEEIEERIRQFDRQLHVISLGGNSPEPLRRLHRMAEHCFPERTISWAYASNTELLEGLVSSRFTMILQDQEFSDDTFCSVPFMQERLYVSVPNSHRSASKNAVTFAELNGDPLLTYAKAGIWEELARVKMPASTLIRLDELSGISELLLSSTTPVLCSDAYLTARPFSVKGRIQLPFSDPEASKQFFITFLRKNQESTRQMVSTMLQKASSSLTLERDTALF